METYANLVLSFYQHLSQDVEQLNLDVEFDVSPIILAMHSKTTPYEDTLRVLCKFGKAIETALIADEKLIVPDHPLFEEKMEGSELPRLTGPMLEILFHHSGYRRHCDKCVEEVNSVYVLILRQTYLAFAKIVDLEPDVDESEEINAFVSRVCTDWYAELDLHRRCSSDILSSARSILADVFTVKIGLELELAAPLAQWVLNPFGCHGPGAVADRSEGPQKWSFEPSKREDLNLYELYKLNEVYESNRRLASMELPPARLCIVPKDFRGHRLICIEPKERMFAQQGLLQIINSMVRENPLTKKSVNFTDQTSSQRACRSDSVATIDLKDASDRISLSLLRVLLPKKVFAVLTRYRSSQVSLPDGRVIEPKCAFTMGNALCFPIETLVFWAICLATVRLSTFENGEYASLEWCARHVRVFGDDIIIPKRFARECLFALSGCGLAVNYQKTCIDTPVRESCGSWWFAGRDVRITRFKYHKLTTMYTWLSWADNARELTSNGFPITGKHVCDLMTKVAPVPYGHLGFPGLKSSGGCEIRYNEELQRVQVRMPALRTGKRIVHLSDWRGLYAWFASRSATQMATRHDADSVEWVWTSL